MVWEGWRREAPPIPIDGREHGARLPAGRAIGVVPASGGSRLADRNTSGVVTAKASPAVENRQPAVGILVHLDGRLHEVGPDRASRDL